MSGIIAGRTAGGVVVVLILLTHTASSASAQTTYTWTGGGGDSNWFTTTNWSPNGTPGVAGSTGNRDQALFDTAGASVTASGQDSGFNLGAIATTGATGGQMTVNFSGNGQLRLNGATVGSFANVAAAAQNGRDLTINVTNMQFAFGTTGTPTTFFADAGRTLTIVDQQVVNLGGAINKEGAGTLIMGGSTGLTRDAGGQAININAGTFAAHMTLDNVTQINVATGAALQAGLTAGGLLTTNTTIAFANNSALKIVTDGSAVSHLDNATLTKGTTDTFQIILTGLNPTGTQTFNPNGIIVSASALTNFDPNGTYTPSSPGHFAVVGDGFSVTDWSLTVLNNNQIQLDSMTVAPVPEPAAVLLLAGVGLAAAGVARRRPGRQPITP